MEVVTIILLIIVFTFFLWYSTKRPKDFPPGLRRLPIIGHIVRGSKPRLGSGKSQKVVGSFFGNYPTTTIHDFHTAKELLNREEWCGRPQNFITKYLRADNGMNKVDREKLLGVSLYITFSGNYYH